MRISDWSSDVCSSDRHAFVDGAAGLDEDLAALFQVPQGVGNRLAGAVGDQDAVAPALDRALVGAVAVEQAVHDAGAAGVCEELAVIADEAARRRQEGDAGLAAAGRSEEHTSEFQSLMRISYAVFCLKKKTHTQYTYLSRLIQHMSYYI